MNLKQQEEQKHEVMKVKVVELVHFYDHKLNMFIEYDEPPTVLSEYYVCAGCDKRFDDEKEALNHMNTGEVI